MGERVMLVAHLAEQLFPTLEGASMTRKNRQMSIKVAQKGFHQKNDRF